MRVAPAGDNAILVELGDVSAEELHRAARAYDGVAPVIIGHSSLYVFRSAATAVAASDAQPQAKTIRVNFNGADLQEFLLKKNLDVATFLARIPTLRLTVRYLGFRGGFGYLDGWPEEWAMPRRPTSRPVARGSFAIAGNIAGFYPIDTPGGWNLLGRTNDDLEHALTPGDVITIEPTLDEFFPSPRLREEGKGEGPFEVLSRFTTLVTPPDYSRLAHGLAPGGPFDEIAAALAARALARCDALLECAMTGPHLRFRDDATVAWCGPDLFVHVYRVAKNEELRLERITGGLRGYLAIGSGEGVVAHIERDDRRVIRAMRGPHDVGLSDIECEVTPKLDRVGVRLRPLRAIDIDIPADLRSYGMQFGTIQLHPDGSLVAMGPDHPVTGGYLQPMTVLSSERWKLGQLVPGERVSFRTDSPSAP